MCSVKLSAGVLEHQLVPSFDCESRVYEAKEATGSSGACAVALTSHRKDASGARSGCSADESSNTNALVEGGAGSRAIVWAFRSMNMDNERRAMSLENSPCR